MKDFEYYTPTRVHFGKGAVDQIGALLREQGAHKVLIHYGGQSARRSGLLDRVEASVEQAGLAFVSLGGVVPNPRLSKVREGIDLARKEGVDFILAVGGGSVIDSAGHRLRYPLGRRRVGLLCRQGQASGGLPCGRGPDSGRRRQ